MNEVIKKAIEIDPCNSSLPNVDVGEEVALYRVWDGEGSPWNGEIPKIGSSYSYVYQISSKTQEKINYKYTLLSTDSDVLEYLVGIDDIEII